MSWIQNKIPTALLVYEPWSLYISKERDSKHCTSASLKGSLGLDVLYIIIYIHDLLAFSILRQVQSDALGKPRATLVFVRWIWFACHSFWRWLLMLVRKSRAFSGMRRTFFAVPLKIFYFRIKSNELFSVPQLSVRQGSLEYSVFSLYFYIRWATF